MGHNGVVAAMATINNGILATGSRDRLIKLYDIGQVSKLESGFSLLPQSTLSPAHYDTVTSLAVIQDVIYSSCGVSIKKWDVSQHSLVQAVDGAHAQSRGNTITSLGVLLPSLLVSGCKSGSLKMWLTDNCQNIGDINNAHASSINSISVNQYSVFTGSNDKTVKIWRPNATLFQN
jgi:kinesin family protein 4/21/27